MSVLDVAFVTKWGKGGAVVWIEEMADRLRRDNINITFYTSDIVTDDTYHPITEDNIIIPAVHLRDTAQAAPRGIGGAIRDFDRFLFAKRAAKKLKETDHDIIHAFSMISLSRYVDSLDVPVVHKISGPPHSLWYDILNPLTSSYNQLNYFDAVVTTGVTTNKVRSRTSTKVKMINPGVDTDLFYPAAYNGEKNILFVGRFGPSKNIPLLLEAFFAIKKRHPSANLTLVGDGPLHNKVREKIDKLDLNQSVKLPGYIPRNDLPRFYQDADLFVLSSRNDNHPIVLLEAMASGLPVIAPKVGYISKMIDNGENGYVYANNSKSELVKKMDVILSNPTVGRKFGTSGRSKMEDQENWEEKSKDLIELYNYLLNG